LHVVPDLVILGLEDQRPILSAQGSGTTTDSARS
jgi:hypothetical protein